MERFNTAEHAPSGSRAVSPAEVVGGKIKHIHFLAADDARQLRASDGARLLSRAVAQTPRLLREQNECLDPRGRHLGERIDFPAYTSW